MHPQYHKFLLIISLLTLCILSTFSCGCLGFFEGYTEKAQQYTSADYSISQYKFFIDKYNTIRQMGAQIKVVSQQIEDYELKHGDVKYWTRTENDHYEEIRFVMNGYIAQYNQFVNEFNSRMRDLTTNQMWMKPQNFPDQLQMYSPSNVITMENPELSYK